MTELTDYQREMIESNILQDVDGFFYWAPEPGNGGLISSWFLREIADILDKKNAAWQQQLSEYFESLDSEYTDLENYFNSA